MRSSLSARTEEPDERANVRVGLPTHHGHERTSAVGQEREQEYPLYGTAVHAHASSGMARWTEPARVGWTDVLDEGQGGSVPNVNVHWLWLVSSPLHSTATLLLTGRVYPPNNSRKTTKYQQSPSNLVPNETRWRYAWRARSVPSTGSVFH